MNANKILNIVKSVLLWAVVAIAVFMMIFTLFSVHMFDKNDRNLFGFRFYTVLSDSMSATDFSAGDIVIVKEVDPSTLKEGDIISFISLDAEGATVTHKIRSLTTDADGNPGFITYGTTTDSDDATVVTYAYILGKYMGHIPGLGNFFQFLKTTPGYIICILIPFMVLILSQGANCIKLFRKYRAEQMEEMQAEKDAIEQEKLNNQKMMEELLAMKAELEARQNGTAPPASEASAETPAAPASSDGAQPTPEEQMAAMMKQMEAMQQQMAQMAQKAQQQSSESAASNGEAPAASDEPKNDPPAEG